jgi:nicotinate (nicotinamide) nucleotide adenylyltransferase/ribosome silencing factor RsfS/YbeB/iojap
MDQRSIGSRVAFFGGSFDPPHLGHLGVARAAREALALDTVLFAPVGAQPLKPQGATASFEDRLAMTRLAIAGETGFAVSLADAPRPLGEPNYTLETLLRLRAELPPGGALFCLMGADSFTALRLWHRAGEIPFVAPLIVASRPGEHLDELKAALPVGLAVVSPRQPDRPGDEIELRRYILRNPAGEMAPLYLLPGLQIEISASEIREQVRAAAGGPAPERELLPAPVSAYIRAHGLYCDLPRPRRGSTMRLGEPTYRMTNDAKQQTRILVQTAAAVCVDKKGEETRILELDAIDSGLSDFFLVTSASNDRQAIAIADEIEHRLKKEFGVFPNSVEGRRKGDWILLDYVDFVVHVFLAERRAFYDIERLRKSARPLTPSEFDAELKAALTEKTVAARKKAAAKAKPVVAMAKPVAKKLVTKKVVVKKAVTKRAVAKKAAVKKAIAKKPAAKKAVAKKAVAKRAVAKRAAKKAVVKKAVVKKAVAKKAVAKKAPARKAGAKKRTGKKS